MPSVNKAVGLLGAASSMATLAYLMCEEGDEETVVVEKREVPGYKASSVNDVLLLKEDIQELKEAINRLDFTLPPWILSEIDSIESEANKISRIAEDVSAQRAGVSRVQALYDRYLALRTCLRVEFSLGHEARPRDFNYTGPAGGPLIEQFVSEPSSSTSVFRTHKNKIITGVVLAILAVITAIAVLGGIGVIGVPALFGLIMGTMISLVVVSVALAKKVIHENQNRIKRVWVKPEHMPEPYGWQDRFLNWKWDGWDD